MTSEPPPSLFLLALPRSLSTFVANVSAQALGLQLPSWTTAAEILNWDRYSQPLKAQVSRPKEFLQRDRDPSSFHRLEAFLDGVVRRRGFLYKEVTQPFVLRHWLARQASLGRAMPVLKLQRDLADIALSMLRQGWTYPALAARSTTTEEDLSSAVVEGLVRARRAMDEVAGDTLEFDHLIHRDGALGDALARLFPDRQLPRAHFLGEAFEHNRDRILSRRESPRHQHLTALVEHWEAVLGCPAEGKP